MVGIISIGQIELCPFVKKYVSALEKENVPYEIVHWNRSAEKGENDDKNVTFSAPLSRYTSLFSKFIPFLKFRSFAKRTIKRKKYDKLIILTTQTAILFPFFLKRRYKGKYVFDYRDASYEYIKPYGAIVRMIAKNAFFTCVSSPKFASVIKSKRELFISHNFSDENYKNRVLSCKKNASGKIVMGYVGYLREYEYLTQLCSLFGNDERFAFEIYGSGDCVEKLKNFCERFENVTVYGAYDEKDKMKIVDSFDMICYNYPKSFVNTPALANKFYDGLTRKKPMFANEETFSGELIKSRGLGISLAQDDKSAADKIYGYYENFNPEEFSHNCESFLDEVIKQDALYVSQIEKFIKE